MDNDGKLRKAVESDEDLLFIWANDSIVRSYSFSTNNISREQHGKWFADLLKTSECVQFIYEYQGVPTGQIRLSMNGDLAELSFSVASARRGLGHGSRMLSLVHDEVRNNYHQIRKLFGRVKLENVASQRTFSKSGYTEVKRKKNYVIYELEINMC